MWEAISFLVHFHHTKDNVIATLQQIELHMKAADIDSRRMKTIGNVMTIMGTVAAPFTGGLSLFATGLGVAVNVTSTVGESALISFLAQKAQEEIELINKITQKIDTLCVDWVGVGITLIKSISDGGIPVVIKKMLSTSARELLRGIPMATITNIILYLEVKITSVIIKLSNNVTATIITGAMKSITKQLSNEAAEQLGKSISKQVGKKVILATVVGVCFGVAFDIYDIIRIWKKGDPKAIKQIQDVIKELRKDDEN